MLDPFRISRFHTMPQRQLILCALLFLVFICAQTNAGTADPKLRKALAERAGFGADQIAALERGEPIAKLISSNDPREVAMCGVIEIPSDPETALKAFQLSLSLKEKSLLQSGKFTNPPRVEDLASLTLSNGDIADLKTCTVGNCKVKLSASMIQRFQKSIDWNATDYQEQANQLFRLMMVEYVRTYLEKGDSALIEYADQSTAVSLAREQESLVTKLLYLNDTNPEFVRHLKALPRSMGPAEHSLTWAMIYFGPRPVLMITDVATYRADINGVPRVLVLSKQIYANHYFDSSLSLTAAIGDHTGTKSDLLYVNYSRSGALASSFSKFKHRIVERRATEDLKGLLGQTRINLDVVLNNSSPSVQPTLIQRISASRVLRIIALLVLLKLVGMAFYLTVGRRLPRFRRRASDKHSNAATEDPSIA